MKVKKKKMHIYVMGIPWECNLNADSVKGLFGGGSESSIKLGICNSVLPDFRMDSICVRLFCIHFEVANSDLLP